MIDKIATQIKDRLDGRCPEIALILGSGLGAIADSLTDEIIISYNELQGFPQSTVSGHAGRLIVGKLEGREILCMQGRVHLYEGHSPREIDNIIKAFKKIGVKTLIVTNAAGSLDVNMPAGSVMLINDHINFSGQNPLIGKNDDSLGVRFPDMSDAYNSEFRNRVEEIAKRENVRLFEGTYLMVMGPNFETAAEIRAFQVLGANAVGMSTVPEVISAIHSGMRVLGLSAITNLGTGLQKQSQSHDETLAQGNKTAENITKLIKGFIKECDNG